MLLGLIAVITIAPDHALGASSTLGTTDGYPVAITIDSDGNIYTANQLADNVTKITPGGTSSTLGTTGTSPRGITIDSDGNIYTANYIAGNVTKITPGGASSTLGTTGTNPRGITIDSDGNIYTANYGSNTVTKIRPGVSTSHFGPTGSGPFGITIDSAGNIYTANLGWNTVTKITPAGVVTPIFGITGTGPFGITIDSAGNIYTTNYIANTVTKITPAGVVTPIFGTTGTNPSGITIDSAGNIYTANYDSNNVTKITPGGTSSILGTTGTNPHAITIDSAGAIYTANYGSHNVTKITSAPDAPTSVAGASGNGQVVVSWNAPVYNRGSTITAYTVTASPGGRTCGWLSGALSCTVTGLTNGTSYTFTATATNAVGTSAASGASAAVTPTGVAVTTTAPANTFTMKLLKISARFITTQLNLPGPGTVVQVGTTRLPTPRATEMAKKARTMIVCRARKTVTKAGKVTITCRLTAKARAARKTHSLKVRLVTTFTPTGGTAFSISRTLVLKQITMKLLQISARSITTQLNLSGPGNVVQVGTTAKKAGTMIVCTARKTVAKAGNVTIICRLTAEARAARKKHSLKVRLVTTFTPTGGTALSISRTLVLTKTR